jgi:hypothetical protein
LQSGTLPSIASRDGNRNNTIYIFSLTHHMPFHHQWTRTSRVFSSINSNSCIANGCTKMKCTSVSCPWNFSRRALCPRPFQRSCRRQERRFSHCPSFPVPRYRALVSRFVEPGCNRWPWQAACMCACICGMYAVNCLLCKCTCSTMVDEIMLHAIFEHDNNLCVYVLTRGICALARRYCVLRGIR